MLRINSAQLVTTLGLTDIGEYLEACEMLYRWLKEGSHESGTSVDNSTSDSSDSNSSPSLAELQI